MKTRAPWWSWPHLSISIGIGISGLLATYSVKCGICALRRDRWALLRCHPWRWVRKLYQRLVIYHFAWKLDAAVRHLPPPVDALDFHPNSEKILDSILSEAAGNNIHTYQKKSSNRLQISSLMSLVCGLVRDIENSLPAITTATDTADTDSSTKVSVARRRAVVLDIGAGKALFTRAVYEALDGEVRAVALDSRSPSKSDQMYDPPEDTGAKYFRVVADVRNMAASTLAILQGKGEEEGAHYQEHRAGIKGEEVKVVAITKHLCGGATDWSLLALCAPPLAPLVGACCFAPCCHQKTKRTQYCNLPYLENLGFCQTHVGVRGQIQDVEWKNFRMLISMSKGGLQDGVTEGGEYKNSQLLQVLGRERACELGRKARRLLEEGRMQYLQQHGYETTLVRYCDESVTGDNWAILARKRGEQRQET